MLPRLLRGLLRKMCDTVAPSFDFIPPELNIVTVGQTMVKRLP